MRRCGVKEKRRLKRRCALWLAAGLLLAGVVYINRYVNTKIKPTLHELAEYEARSATTQAINRAMAAELLRTPSLHTKLFVQEDGIVSLDAAAASAAQVQLIRAVQTEVDALPETDYRVPLGSLTDNTLLSGFGPGWRVQMQPKGYVQGEIQEKAESLSINTTRYSAVLRLCVTVNMILDGSTATLTVDAEYPLANILIVGDTPGAYAADIH